MVTGTLAQRTDVILRTTPEAEPPGRRTRSTPRAIQIALGWIWILDGALQFQPSMFGRGFVTNILLPNAQGQPAPLAWSITTLSHFVSPDVGVWNFLFGSVQLLIGVGLLCRRTVKPAIVVMAVWAFGVWWFGEGFGMLFTGAASPLTGAPGAVLLYPVIGLLVWPTGARQEKDSVGLDSSPGASGPLGRYAPLGAWSGFWIVSALLWLLPANRTAGAIDSQISHAALGEPAWYSHMLTSVAAAIGSHTTLLAWELSLVSLVIGLGPWCTRRPGFFLVLGVGLEVAFWITGMALGGMMTGSGTDPNAAPLVLLLALTVLPTVATPAAEAPIRRIAQSHPFGVGLAGGALCATLLLCSTYPVAGAGTTSTASVPHPSGPVVSATDAAELASTPGRPTPQGASDPRYPDVYVRQPL
jgi:hypothetical protein